jgi:hypothetical protein
MERASTTVATSRSMFWLTAGATLRCRDVGLVLEAEPLQEESSATLFDRIVTVARSESADRESVGTEAAGSEPVPATAGAAPRVVLEMTNVMFNGDATWCRVEGGSNVSMRWTRGSATTSGRFLEVVGNASPSEPEAVLSLDLEDATFACQQGFARLTDTPAQSRVPRLEATVARCRFLVPEPSALLEQVGVAEPEIYQVAIDWQDWRGRYEGSRCYRRIDGAGDPIEIDYASAGRPLLYQPGLDAWPGGNAGSR